MKKIVINNFEDFYLALHDAGFSLAGENDEDVFSLNQYYTNQIETHTGIVDTDPWVWRMRVVLEKKDILYSKVFFKKGGFITKKWVPYFLAIRRNKQNFDDMYADGKMTYTSKDIYQLIDKNPGIALSEIKTALGYHTKLKSQFNNDLTSLQMAMLITINGEKYKLSNDLKPYGWPVTTFCTIEHNFGEEIIAKSNEISKSKAIEKITKQVYKLNKKASIKKINRFIGV